MSTLRTTNIRHISANSSAITLAADGTVAISTITGSCLASVSNIAGVNTTGVTTSGSAIVSLTGSLSASQISNGDYVVGTGITVGTTVSSGGGTNQVTLSQTAGISLATNPLTFYTNNKIVTPGVIGGQLCRAWVNFNGTSTVAIRASYNVSSITDNGTGDYTVNFTTAMPDTNYVVIGSGGPNVAAGNNATSGTILTPNAITSSPFTVPSPSTSSVRIITITTPSNFSTGVDTAFINVAIFR